MRPFLAFDTSSDHLGLAVGDLDVPGAVLAAADLPAPRAANTVVLAVAERLLAGAGLESTGLAAVAVGRGPGSFTGVRIGVATAKGIAHGLGVPLVGFGTLDAVAHRAARAVATGEAGLRGVVDAVRGPVFLGVLGDAMRGEVYPALFSLRTGDDGVLHTVRLAPDRVAKPAAVAAEWSALDRPLLVTGNALRKHREAFEAISAASGVRAAFAPERLWAADGPAIIAAAWAEAGSASLAAIASLDRAAAYATAPPSALLPVYTRLADAEEAERLRLGRADAPTPGGVAGPLGERR